MNERIDWARLFKQVNEESFSSDESEGTTKAQAMLETLLGHQAIKDAVDFGIHGEINGTPGAYTTKALLMLLASRSAFDRAYEIFRETHDSQVREEAARWIRDCGVWHGLEVIEEFLSDADSGVQNMGIEYLRKMRDYIDGEERERLLKIGDNHNSDHVRAWTQEIRKEIQAEEESASGST